MNITNLQEQHLRSKHCHTRGGERTGSFKVMSHIISNYMQPRKTNGTTHNLAYFSFKKHNNISIVYHRLLQLCILNNTHNVITSKHTSHKITKQLKNLRIELSTRNYLETKRSIKSNCNM